ncbi:MAG TPA: PASTA domain-containing protein [Acidobacteriaceae bacterium]|nr:PASTA domain-containing protein [Acidobacteriaceae bacterium]
MIRFFRLVLAVMVLAIVALLSAVTTMHFAIHGAEVQVPDLAGLTIAEAVRKTANEGLNLSVDNKYYSADLPAGRVLSQSPAPGTVVRREWRMRVTESLGPQRVTIPDVVGQPERVAAIEARRLGLELEETSQMPWTTAPPGTVIAQNPQKGAEGVARPSISLLVSTAPPAAGSAFVMPQFVGMPYSTAAALIAQAGFKLGPMVDDDSAPEDTVHPDQPAPPPGIIMTQTPAAGHRVDGSTYIALTISQ